MPSKNQITGMLGVYLVAAELARHGYIASPTSRSARGADILVTDARCSDAFSVQVRTNAALTSYWLLNEHAKDMVSDSHIYVFVNLKKENTPPEFFVVPSQVVADNMWIEKHGGEKWYGIQRADVMHFKGKWSIFGPTV